ncbi:MAG: hypothetical protein ACK5YI_07170 [Rhodospirillales bacterium]|jgi:hypothetical protein
MTRSRRERRARQARQAAVRITVGLVLFVVLVGLAATGLLVLQTIAFVLLGVIGGLAIGDMRPLARFDARAWRGAVATFAVGALVVIATRVTASQALIGGGLGILAGILWAAQDPGVFAKLLGLASGRIDDGFSPHRRRTLSDVIAEEMAGGLKPPTELPPLKPPGDPDAPLDLDRQVAPESPRVPDDAEIRARLARAEMELKDARWRIRTLQEENGGLQQELAVANAKGSQEVGVLRLRLQEVEAKARRCDERLAEAERAAQARPPERLPSIAVPTPAEGASDRRFQDAKRAFARRFHPDFVNATGMERTLRIDLFKEFWGDLERIERGSDTPSG